MGRLKAWARKNTPTLGKIFGIRPLKDKNRKPTLAVRNQWRVKLMGLGFTAQQAKHMIGDVDDQVTYGEIVQRAIATMKNLPSA